MPATGRAMNPTSAVVYASIVPTRGSNDGKNSLLKTSAENVLYRKKSYHSIVQPIALANATLRISTSATGVWSAVVAMLRSPSVNQGNTPGGAGFWRGTAPAMAAVMRHAALSFRLTSGRRRICVGVWRVGVNVAVMAAAASLIAGTKP